MTKITITCKRAGYINLKNYKEKFYFSLEYVERT